MAMSFYDIWHNKFGTLISHRCLGNGYLIGPFQYELPRVTRRISSSELLLYRSKKMVVYAAVLLDFQKGGVRGRREGVGYITKGNGLLFFLVNITEFIRYIFFHGNGLADAWQPPPPSKFVLRQDS